MTITDHNGLPTRLDHGIKRLRAISITTTPAWPRLLGYACLVMDIISNCMIRQYQTSYIKTEQKHKIKIK